MIFGVRSTLHQWSPLPTHSRQWRAREGWVETIPPQERCWPVLVHQLLAFTLAAGGVSRDLAWEKLSRLPDLAGIMRFEFDQTVDYMVLHDGRGGRAAVRAKRTSSSSTA
jgi:hypothetical protein